jgi:hypothetical protein
MSDAYVVGDPDGLSPLLVALRDAVARELHAQLALRGERIELADLPEVSYQVTLRVDETLRSILSRRHPPVGPDALSRPNKAATDRRGRHRDADRPRAEVRR